MSHPYEALLQLARQRAADIADFAARRFEILNAHPDTRHEAALWQNIEADAQRVTRHITNVLKIKDDESHP